MVATSVATILRAPSRRSELALPELSFADGWLVAINLAFLGLFLLTAVAWLVWQHRAHTRLNLLTKPHFRPAAIWWWLVPVATLFMPFMAVSELMRAGTDRPALRRWWWATFLSWNALSGILVVLTAARAIDVVPIELAQIGVTGLGLIATRLASRIVAQVDRGLAARREEATEPVPDRAWSRTQSLAFGAGGLLLAAIGGVGFGFALPAADRFALENSGVTPEFAVGECFDETDDFTRADCDDRHFAEVFLVVDHPDQIGYPGDRAVAEWAEPVCYGEFEQYTGIAYEQSPLDFGYLYPTSEGWAAGDREVVCYIFDPSGELTAPIRTDSAA
jgi:hypothetical protein